LATGAVNNHTSLTLSCYDFAMKPLLAVLLAVVLVTAPCPAAPKQPTITINAAQADVVPILRRISTRLGYNIVIDQTVKGRITVSVTDMPAWRALKLVTKMAGYEYNLYEHLIVVGSRETLQNFPNPDIYPGR